jgi:hypothetical protein
MKTLKEQIDGRPQKSMALDVNNKNARRALFGKYNAAYANGMSRWQMHRTFKSGAKLIKQTLKDLKKLSKTLEKDIEELEKALSPEHAAETAKKEQTQRMEYEQVLAKTVGDLARSVGFTINGPMPNDQSYSVCQCNSLSLLEFYLKGFNPELQYNPAAAGHLNIQEMPGNIYLVMVPKAVADLVKRPELQFAPIVQSTLANDGITFDDKINVDAMTLHDARLKNPASRRGFLHKCLNLYIRRRILCRYLRKRMNHGCSTIKSITSSTQVQTFHKTFFYLST